MRVDVVDGFDAWALVFGAREEDGGGPTEWFDVVDHLAESLPNERSGARLAAKRRHRESLRRAHTASECGP